MWKKLACAVTLDMGECFYKGRAKKLNNRPMKKTVSFVISSILVAQIMPLVAFAETESASTAKPEVQERRQQFREGIQQRREQFKLEIKQKENEVRQGIKERLSAFRQETKEKRATLRAEVKAKREALAAELKAKREVFQRETKKREEELKKKLGKRRAANVEKYFGQMVEKLSNIIDRLNELADKIQARFDKAAANGKDITALKDKLAKAREKIAAANQALQNAQATYTAAVQEKDFKVAFKRVRGVVHDVAAKIRDAHAALVDVINSIKGLGNRGGTAPSTPAGTSTTSSSR